MKTELIISIVGFLGMFLIFASGNPPMMAMVALAIVAYSAYCGYHYKGGKSYQYALMPVISFIIFIVSSQVMAGIMVTLLMLAWIVVVLAAAWHCDTAKTPSAVTPPTSTGKYCPGCGTGLDISTAFCPSCGAKQ